jgi:GNAT superfamily N-acetyltransferase
VIDAPPGHLAVTVWFLECRRPPPDPMPSAPLGVSLVRVHRPDRAYYRFLYDATGEPWLWYGRRKISAGELGAWLADPAMELWVPMVEGSPAGMVELDRGPPDSCEIAYFGLRPGFMGRRIGPWLLDRALRIAFAAGAPKVTLNTCSLDHPRALEVYLAGGFDEVRRETRVEPDPRALGHLPKTAGPHVPYIGP